MPDIAPTGRPGEIHDLLRWNSDGLVMAVAQAQDSGEVLMVAWVNPEALRRTLAEGIATYWSRSRNRIWVKGEESGYTQRIVEVRTDCDGDCLLYVVIAPGPACHQLRRSCFSNRVDANGAVTCDRPVIA